MLDVKLKPIFISIEVDIFQDVQVMDKDDDFDDGRAKIIGLRQRIFEFFYCNAVLFFRLFSL